MAANGSQWRRGALSTVDSCDCPWIRDRRNVRPWKKDGVAARPCYAIDKSGADRIGHVGEHDRHQAGCGNNGPRGKAYRGLNDVHDWKISQLQLMVASSD